MSISSQQVPFNTVIAGNGVIYVSLRESMTIELDIAEQIIESCLNNITVNDGNVGLILNMNKVAFVTEEARNYLSDISLIRKGITHLALISNSHLSNVISTLMIENGDSPEQIPMKLLKTTESAVDWLQSQTKVNAQLVAAV